jgi:LonC protease-like protein
VYALGASGTGRHSMVEDLLRRKAESEPTPPDWWYVNNLEDSQRPRRLQLPAGRGAGLAAAMKRLVQELRDALPGAFDPASQQTMPVPAAIPQDMEDAKFRRYQVNVIVR